MAKPRRTKKSESIEVRLSHPLKVAFMERCREHGRSASDVIRAFIDDYLADPPSKSLEYQKMLFKAFKPAAAVTATLAIVWMVAAPAPVAAAPELRVLFDGLDANSDGMIELAEFLPAGPGVVSRGSEKSLIGPGAGPIQAAPAGPFPAGTAAPFPKAAFEAEFLAQDADKNAKVSYDEFTAYHRKMLRSGFDGLDRNKDGGIDKAEYAAHGTSKKLVGPGEEPSMSPGGDFTHFDRDGNGRIDWEEFGNPQAG